MSRRKLCRNVKERFDNMTNNLTLKFDSIEHFSSTCDIWSTKYRSFIAVTLHWVNNLI